MRSGRTGDVGWAGAQFGFSLIELMIVLAVAVIFVVMAAPMYVDFRERSVVRGAAGDLVAMTQRAKLEAAKRNNFVTVSVRGSGSAWCIGLQTTSTGCDCLSATCDIDQINTVSLNGARLLSAASFNGGSTDFSIDPRLGMLSGLAAGGSLVIQSPSNRWDYRLQFNLTSTAQTNLCSPAGGRALSDYASC